MPRKRKLITSLTPTTKQHVKPCSDCPFRRDSLPGWLGGNSASNFVEMAQSDASYNCHVKEQPTGKPWHCAGVAVFRANICKSLRIQGTAPEVEKDEVNVFAWPTGIHETSWRRLEGL